MADQSFMARFPLQEIQTMTYELLCAFKASEFFAGERKRRPLSTIDSQFEDYYVLTRLVNVALRVRSLNEEKRMSRAGIDGWKDQDEVGKISFQSRGHGKVKTQLCTIRNLCNKILHADEVLLLRAQDGDGVQLGLLGKIEVIGKDESSAWRCTFDVAVFCDAAVSRAWNFMSRFPM
jgi:hypothetical protein